MELLTLMVPFLLAILLLLAAPCASDQLHLNKQLQKDGDDYAKFNQPSSLPRKLNLNHQVKISAAEEDSTHHKALHKGNKQQEIEENVINAAEKETWKSEVAKDEEEKEEYSTMDYGWVKRRRPIHNKQIPFIP